MDDDEDDVGDEQPLLSSHCRTVSPPPLSHSSTAAVTASSSPPVRSVLSVSVSPLSVVSVVAVLVVLAVVLAVLLSLSSFEQSSSSSSYSSSAIQPHFLSPLQRGRAVARETWQALSSLWPLSSGAPSASTVDVARLAAARCLGHATKLPLPASVSLPLSHCPVPPSSIVSTFFPSFLQLYPSVLTHRPRFSCDRGTYLWVDWQYTDGMGNSLWAYSVVLSVAMAVNATILSFPFIATHTEAESNEERRLLFAFDEWEVDRARWESCPSQSAVKANQLTLPRITAEYTAGEPMLHSARQWMRAVQVEQAAAANSTHLNASLTATSSYRYMTPHFTYTTVSLPRVDNDGPGLTVHLKELGIDGPWTLGMFAPGVEVAKVHEIRWMAQQMHWRGHTQPVESVEPVKPVELASSVLPSIPSSFSSASASSASSANRSSSEAISSSPTAVWLTSDDIHVAIPVRRGDVSGGTAGGQLLISIDMRARVMTDAAIAQLLNQTIAVVRSIAANSSAPSLPLPSASEQSFPVRYEPSPLSGRELVSRLIFTIYSEGPADGFTVLTDTLRLNGIDASRVRLRVNEKASRTFALLASSDLLLLSPSSFSYAASCYFNSEGVHVGSGWSFNRFAGCHNFVDAEWRRYIVRPDEVRQGERYIPAEDVSVPQWWAMDEHNEAELRRRVERLVARKERQRWAVEPIVQDNFREDYPRQWMFDADRPQLVRELHAPRVSRSNTTTTV